ncbi:hypothetical protein [Salinicola acroporae]|uniref:Lipoprotein n=1 Tax=Salinicola acroporae TaxID=1541440 RepID=A0ABT6I5D0_9GAMM|nr:hypothetical protein [Salinicola acroporae]MDH4572736.1 hypothetical protein [Salinicola acroporae]
MPRLALTLTLCAGVALSACQQRDASNQDTDAAKETFQAANYPLEVRYDASLIRVDGEVSSYFDNGGWQLSDDAPGDRLILLELPESDDEETALWRLGASRDEEAVANCLRLPANAQATPSKTTLAGEAFSGFTLGDAGMSHFQNVEGYRAVVNDTCYAIDLIVQGTDGEVYDPPRQPPFSSDEAMERLRTISDGLSFNGK